MLLNFLLLKYKASVWYSFSNLKFITLAHQVLTLKLRNIVLSCNYLHTHYLPFLDIENIVLSCTHINSSLNYTRAHNITNWQNNMALAVYKLNYFFFLVSSVTQNEGLKIKSQIIVSFQLNLLIMRFAQHWHKFRYL